ncbi:MAG: TetR/AcrR family transcriptional regulator [Candidatus Hermodarchaeota archaeon]
MTVRTEDKKNTITKIVKTFYNLIQKKGYVNVSIRDIRNKAKVSIGAIYHHFPQGKVDILNEIIIRNRDKIIGIDLFNDIDESELEKSINKIMLNFIDFHRENIQFNLALEQELLLKKEIFHNFKLLIEEALVNLAKKLKTFKVFRNISEKKLREKLFLIFNIIEAIILRHISLIPLFETDEELRVYLTNLVLFHFSN